MNTKKMVKLRAGRSMRWGGKTLKKGQLVEIEAHRAPALIAAGLFFVAPPKPKKVEAKTTK